MHVTNAIRKFSHLREWTDFNQTNSSTFALVWLSLTKHINSANSADINTNVSINVRMLITLQHPAKNLYKSLEKKNHSKLPSGIYWFHWNLTNSQHTLNIAKSLAQKASSKLGVELSPALRERCSTQQNRAVVFRKVSQDSFTASCGPGSSYMKSGHE